MNNKIVDRHVISIKSTGCEWCKDGGGCIMCGHFAAATGKQTSVNGVIKEIKKLERCTKDIILCIYNGGSILNPNELSFFKLSQLLRAVSTINCVKQLVLETRPEYVSTSIISETNSFLRSDQELVLGIGLEIKNDLIRSLCINKGYTYQNFLEKTAPFRSMIRGYIFFGSPFLSELEIISDCFSTIVEADTLNLNEIYLEVATIQQNTPLARLWENDFYELPSLWSLVMLLKILPKKIKPYISPFTYFPMPKYAPTTCSKCSNLIFERIDLYNRTKNDAVFDDVNCQYLDSWFDKVNTIDNEFLENRVVKVLEAFL